MSTTTQLTPKPVNFKFGNYISQGIDLLKKNYLPIFLAFIFTLILTIIPFCGFLAIGNLLKFLRKIDNGEDASSSEIFDFSDFMKYFVFQLIIYIGLLVLNAPMFILILISNGGQPSEILGILSGLYIVFLVLATFYFIVKSYYMVSLMSLKGISNWREAWEISKVMTNGNFWSIIFFSIAIAIIGELGLILCGIGVFLTLPFVYCASYFSYKDGLEQIENDNFKTLG